MKILALILLVACGGKQTPVGPTGGSGSGSDTGPVKDTRSAIEKRRDIACEQVGKKLTACALADAKADLAAGKVTKKDFDLNTEPKILQKHTDDFVKACEVPMSSRQVRVYEICFKEETECGPLVDCLDHVKDQPAK